MWAGLSLLSLLTLIAGAVIWRRRSERAEWLRLGALTLIGLTLAAPFLTHRSVGTGEAYNYSLAVADAIEQARHGTFPVWVGETDHAFNGRIHPLRTAVYFAHTAIGLDLLTGRTLSAWHLQNLLLALSLAGAGLSAYGCLRLLRVTSPNVACALAALYATSPAWLNAAYGSDLYMTVTTAPFLPVAFLGAVLGARGQPWRGHLLLAVGLAATWLAHPPVAAWATLAGGVVVAANVLTRRTRLADWASLAAAAVVGLVLIAWPLASALGLPGDSVAADTAGTRRTLAEAIWRNTAGVSWTTLLPVAPASGALSNFQTGLATLALLALATGVALRTRERAVIGLLAAAAGCFLLTLPIPGLHRWLWLSLPAAFASLTNVWPMQRAYVVIAALALFAIALAWPVIAHRFRAATPRRRRLVIGALAALALWSIHQALTFVHHGFGLRATEEQTAQWQQRTNRSLTPIAYAFFQIPDRYENGPRDPRLDLRLFSATDLKTVVADNLTHAAAGRVVAEGECRLDEGSTNEIWRLTAPVTLEPGRRYRLRWEFLTAPIDGLLIVSGDRLWRHLPLSSPTPPGTFGMGGRHTPVLPLWIDGDAAETVRFAVVPSVKGQPTFEFFARYTLEEIDVSKLPIRVSRVSPGLVAEVDAPTEAWLETPRMFLAGYRATVDGRPVVPRRAPDGSTWVPLPGGSHRVILTYDPGAWPRRAATASLIGWALVAVVGSARLLRIGRLPTSIAPPRRHGLALAGSITLLCGAAWLANHLRHPNAALATPPGNAPLELTLALPIDSDGRSDPLFSSGRGPGSSTAFVRYEGPGIIRLGLDRWGEEQRLSPPLSVDPREPVTVRLSSPLFYPPGSLAGETIDTRTWLESTTAIWLNGSRVLTSATHYAAPRRAPVALVESHTGSSSHSPSFRGIVVGVRWLTNAEHPSPYPTQHSLANDAGPLRLTLRLPRHETGIVDPVASWRDPRTGGGYCFFVRYLDAGRLQLGIDGTDLPATETPPIAHDYETPLTLTLSHPALFPANVPTPGYSKGQRALLQNRLRIGVDGGPTLSLPIPPAGLPDADRAELRIGYNTVAAPLPRREAHLTVDASQRLPLPAWPVPPGDLDRAIDASAFGPLELQVRLPIGATGRRQPLLTTGRTGAGTFVIIDYLDPKRIRIGVDIWNQVLLWSEPITCDYNQIQRITIAHSALFPANSPAARALPPESLRALRETVTVHVGDAPAIHAPLPAYDARPGEITPGETRIGGSNTDPTFTGELLTLTRLPTPPPPTK